jgi:aminoglycoside phosphotransferase (APT) family kinase protein
VSILGPRAARRPRLSRALDAVRRAAERRSALSDAKSVVPVAMASLAGPTDGWSIERAAHGGGGISAFLLRTRNGEGLMVKVARAEAGRASLERAAGAQRAIAGIDALGSWRSRVPAVLSDGHAGAWRFVVETAVTGRPLTLPAPGDPAWPATLGAAIDAIDGLHCQTASTPAASSALTADRPRRWVGQRIAAVAGLGPAIAGRDPAVGRALASGLERLAIQLDAVIGAGDLSAGWTHGDYWSANLLVDEAGAVSGIVDWDSAEPDELAAHDVFHLVLYARKLRRKAPLGAVVSDLLGGVALDPLELAALERACPPGVDTRTMALLYWLRFIESNLRRQPGLATTDRWLAGNVGAVASWL